MKMFLLGVFTLLQAAVYAQDDLPARVKNAFDGKFPNAEIYDWRQEGIDFTIEFASGDAEMTAIFDDAGAWKATRTYLSEDRIPQAAGKAVEARFKNAYIESVQEVSETNNSYLEFVVVEDDGTNIVKVDNAGKILETVKVQEEVYQEEGWDE